MQGAVGNGRGGAGGLDRSWYAVGFQSNVHKGAHCTVLCTATTLTSVKPCSPRMARKRLSSLSEMLLASTKQSHRLTLSGTHLCSPVAHAPFSRRWFTGTSLQPPGSSPHQAPIGSWSVAEFRYAHPYMLLSDKQVSDATNVSQTQAVESWIDRYIGARFTQLVR